MTAVKESPVRVCFLGKNRSGTWSIRGEQIAGTRSNWYATIDPSSVDWESYDVFCIIKHPVLWVIEELKRREKAVVYDVLDSWAQPADGLKCKNLQDVKEYFKCKWDPLGLNFFIFPNRTMKSDLAGYVKYSTFIYHHYWPHREVNLIRQCPQVVAYEGNESYLGEWKDVLKNVCQELGLRFEANPDHWAGVDIGVAVRGGVHDSFMANRYKSNVKLANMYGSGTPALAGYKEISCHETDSGDVRFFKDELDLRNQLKKLLDYNMRTAIHEQFVRERAKYSLSAIADIYEEFFLWVRYQDNKERDYLKKKRIPALGISDILRRLRGGPIVPSRSDKPKNKPVKDRDQVGGTQIKSDGDEAYGVEKGPKVNLGCGDKLLEGYINVDRAGSRKGQIPNVIADLRCLSFHEATIQEILSVHVIEHFYYWEAQELLLEWKRILKAGGSIIIECPNILEAAKQLLQEPGVRSRPDKEGQMTMWAFYGDPSWKDHLMCHRWGYTPESLMALLECVGFTNVRREPAQFKKREPRDMRIVGQKPGLDI